MRALFERLKADGEIAIESLITDRQQEGLQLDFKRAEKPTSGDFADGDKRQLGRALSGFSNSMGGLLIFGVEARKGPDDVDCAISVDPIHKIAKFESRAKSLIAHLVSPVNEEIEVVRIDSTKSQGAGYLAILINRSERRPHRSEAKDDKQYFKRVGDSFMPMEHYDIEDMFNRMTTPKLELVHEIRKGVSVGDKANGEHAILYTIGLRNTSLVTAKFPYLCIDSIKGTSIYEFGLDGNRTFGLKFRRDAKHLLFEGGADVVIHPDQRRLVLPLVLTAKTRLGTIFNINNHWPYPGFSFEYQFGCENVRTISGRTSVDAQSAQKLIEENL